MSDHWSTSRPNSDSRNLGDVSGSHDVWFWKAVDDAANRFEEAYRNGQPLRVENVLSECDSQLRRALLMELLIVDMHHRALAGERFAFDEYLRRFPELVEDESELRQLRERHSKIVELATTAVSQSEADVPQTLVRDATLVEGASFDAAEWSVRANQAMSNSPTRLLLERELARGGLGQIWLARDQVLQREVAYKELRTERRRDQGMVERFVFEAQITGQLEHPSIVPIYDLGWQSDGIPYYTMKLVRGRTYLQAIREYHELESNSSERRLRFHQLLRQLIAVCQAIAFAHARSVLHRDLKPQNIMLGDFGETLVLDWGLAKILGTPEPRSTLVPEADVGAELSRSSMAINSRTPSETMAGVVLGTPAYMSPEQARGDLANVGMRSDVYSLGAILYHVLTNRPPFDGRSAAELLPQVIAGSMPPIRTVAPQTPRALVAICEKCLAGDQERRFSSVRQLAEELERYLADEPVSAYRESIAARARRWCRLHRAAVAGIATAATIMLCGMAIWWFVEWRQTQHIGNQVHELWTMADERIDRSDYSIARDHLMEAAGQARGRAATSELAADANNRLRLLDKLLRSFADDKAKAARTALGERQDLATASALLGDAFALANISPALVDLQQDLRKEQNRIQQLQNEKTEVVAEQTRFETFLKQADLARFFGCQFTADDNETYAAETRRWAESALRIYGLDQFVETTGWPSHFSDTQIVDLQQRAVELCLLLAEAELLCIARPSEEEQLNASRRGLEWLRLATSFPPRPSRAIVLLQAELQHRLGEESNAKQSRAVAEKLEPIQAWEFFQLAEIERRNHGRYLAAASLYQSALNQDRNYYLAAYFLGVTYLQEFRSRLSTAGEASAARVVAANQADHDGLLSAAQTAFTLCISQRPDFPWSRLLRAVTLGYRGQFDAAEVDLMAATKFPLDPQVGYDVELFRFALALNRGSIRLMQGRLADAEADFQQAIELRPDSAEAHGDRAEVLFQQKRDADAVMAWNRAVDLAPQRAASYRRRGEIRLRLKQVDAARQDFMRSAELDDNPAWKADCLWEAARIHFRSKNWDAAIELLNSAIQFEPAHADAHRLRAETLLQLKRDNESAAAFSNYLALRDTRDAATNAVLGDVYRARGIAHDLGGDPRSALADYTRSLDFQPAANILTQRGWLLLRSATELALLDFDAAIKLNPRDGRSFSGRGYVRVQRGDYQSAVQDAEEAAQLGPRVWQMSFDLVAIYAQAVTALKQDRRVSDTEREELSAGYTRRALELLENATRLAGEEDVAVLRKSLDQNRVMEPLHSQTEYQAIRRRLDRP